MVFNLAKKWPLGWGSYSHGTAVMIVMTTQCRFLSSLIPYGIFISSLSALPIVGVDFDDGVGGDDTTPDDLEVTDGVTVSDWVFSGGGIAVADASSNTDRVSAPVRKFNGPNNSSATPPAIGDAPPTNGVHSFSITIDDVPIDLNKVQFNFSKATESANIRWIAFRTSLDTNIIFSQVGEARPAFPLVEIVLSDPKYKNLSDQEVEFIWYCGGQGTGDMDIDSIVIDASGGSFVDIDGDLLADSFEQLIIDADAGDAITSIADVLSGDDFDADGSSNLIEQDMGTNPVDEDTDGDGLLDGVETNSGTFDDLLVDTGTSPLDPDTDGDGLPDGVETNDGSFNDIVTDTGTNPVLADTDSDAIPDGYEVGNSLNPFINDAALDPDADSSDNLEEFTRGTDPQLDDTDNDGIKDGPETDDGTFDGLNDTGTDPLDADTDDDGLLDGDETNTGVYVNETDTGTDPLMEDSDADNFRDGAEVNLHRTDPNNAGKAPTGLSVLFVGGSANGTTGSDAQVIDYIQDKYGISNVRYMQAADAVDGDEDGYDLLVLSSTPISDDIRDKFEDASVPVANYEEAISDNQAGEFGLASAILSKSLVTTEMTHTGHPITAGLPDPVVLFNEAGPQTNSTGALFPGLTSAGNDAGTGEPMIFVAEQGDALDPGALVPGDVAPARRVMLPWTDSAPGNLTADGWQLFGNALDWAVGRLGGSQSLVITQIEYDDSSDPDNILVNLTFNSSDGVSYTLYADTGLSVPLADQIKVDDSVTGEAGSTSVEVNFNNLGLNINSPSYFFTLREN